MKQIYLSPHLDDAVYSCGGKIAQDIRRGNSVEIWTVFAGDPSSDLTPFALELHARWGAGAESVAKRRAEDIAACGMLGVGHRHLPHPDCIYRRLPLSDEPVIRTNDDLFLPVRPEEQALILQIRDEFLQLNPENRPFYCPLVIGGHMDHRLVRAAAESTGSPLIYYADFPYAADPSFDLESFIPSGCEPQEVTLAEEDLREWTAAAAAYSSQYSSFWPSIEGMQSAIRAYSRTVPGHTVWKCVAYRGFR